MSLPDRILLAAFLAAAGTAALCADPPRDPLIQTRVEEAVASVVRQDEDALARIELLRDLGEGRRPALLVQIALYLETAAGTEQSMAGALIVKHLAFTPEEKLDATLPHLMGANPKLRRVFTELLATIDRPEGDGADFRIYEERILREKDAPEEALILYIYEVSPGDALATMERVYGGGASRRSPRAETAAALADIARDAAWWRRLYAAAVLRERPELATPEVSHRLENDAHPLVRRAAGGASFQDSLH